MMAWGGVAGGLLWAGCGSSGVVEAPCYSVAQFQRQSLPSFSSYLMNVPSDTGSRIDVYLQMPYNKVRFEKYGNEFQASYAILCVLRNEDDAVVQTKEEDRSISTTSYAESVSERFDPSLRSFIVSPGRYRLDIVATDNGSKLRYRRSVDVTAVDFRKPDVLAGPPLYLDTIIADVRGVSIRPIIPTSLSRSRSSFGLFQEVYHRASGDTVTVSESYYSFPDTTATIENFISFVPPYRSVQQNCRQRYEERYYHDDSVFITQQAGVVRLFQTYPMPREGSSLLERVIRVGRDSTRTSMTIFLRDPRYQSVPSPEEMVFALRFIMRDDEFDSLRADSAHRSERMRDFWDQRGGRSRSEEFTQRVAEANAMFTSTVSGSRTPMGIVSIVCGLPDYVDCRGPYYENWYYTIGDRSYGLQFKHDSTDKSEGCFELVPFSVNDTMWQYFIDRWRRTK